MNALNLATRAVVEGMSGSPAAEKRKETYVDLISVAKPAKSVWQVLGLYIFMSLIRP